MQRDIMIAAAATAVGINMTFLLPFSLLAKKWNRSFRGLAIFDLATGMVIPFVLATSCIVIAAATQFHAKPFDGLLETANGETMVNQNSAKYADYAKLMDARGATSIQAQPEEAEMRIASMLIQRGTGDLAASLKSLFKGSDVVSNYVFGFGVLAMAISTISILMLISGFCVCEAMGRPHGGWTHRLGTLIPMTGVLRPWLDRTIKVYLAVPIPFWLCPHSHCAFAFLLMMNNRKCWESTCLEDPPIHLEFVDGGRLPGDGSCSSLKAWGTSLNGIPVGSYALIGFVVLVLFGFGFREKEKV